MALLLVMLSLLIAVPTAFAFDNDTVVSSDAGSVVLADDYYFDADLPNDDGNGSIDNPYKDLTSNRILDNSIIHLNDGEYNLDYSKTVRNVTFIGQNTENTIINGNGRIFTVSTSFTLCNVTLMNLKIKNNGDLTATGTIFRDSTSSNGGAIESAGNSKVYLDNCTFLNNTATNGGAIYKKGGNLSIQDSTFILNSAANYGGAIYCEELYDFCVNDTSFSDNRAINYFGGAIYLYESDFNALNMIITNSSANFGGGIMARDSYLDLTNLTATENRAEYNGGAIYTIYGGLYIYESLLQSNQALNGGAIFTNMLNEFECLNNNFTCNFANYTGGAVYDVCSDIFIENNTCLDNHAGVDDDFCLLDVPNMVIGDANYTLLKINSTYDGDLPSRYDLRELGQVTPVKNQGSGGNCWAFAIISALESSILKATGISYDLSEDNPKNLMAFYSEYGWAMETNVGGYLRQGYAYLTSWLGPVNESDDGYNYKSFLSPLLHSFFHVQNIIFLERKNYTDNDEVKRAIMNYGAVGTSIYMTSTIYQYYTGTSQNNHAVTLVGWDDSLEFNGAPGPGGWIAKNSWGPNSLDHGYFYVSYYDVSCLKPETSDKPFAIILNDTIRYDKNYQYDIPGETDYFYNTTSTVWYKTKFTSTDDEYLAAVSTYFNKKTNWDLKVYVNDELKLTQSGFNLAGYYTIDLNQMLQLHEDDEFVVEFKITVDGDAGVPISEPVSLNVDMYGENMSFISYDGENWADFYGLEGSYPDHSYYSQVACIKAFTVLNPIKTYINMTVLEYSNPVLIEAVVYDEYGNVFNSGELTFTTDGNSYTVNIENGVARFSYAYSTFGDKSIQANFHKLGYENASNEIIVPVNDKGIVEVHADITVNYTDVLIKITLSRPLNERVHIAVNDDDYEINTTEGVGYLSLDDLYYGSYLVIAYPLSDSYISISSYNSFSINYYNTYILVFNTEDYYGEDCAFNIALVDKHINPIADKNITFTIDDFSDTTTTDEYGRAFLIFRNVMGTYNVNIAFDGEGSYLNTSANVTFTVLKSDVEVHTDITVNYTDAFINITLSKPINQWVYVSVNGEVHSVYVTGGVGSLSLPAQYYGNYTVDTYFVSPYYNCIGSTDSFEISYYNTFIGYYYTEVYYSGNCTFKVMLVDSKLNPIPHKNITFIIGNSSTVMETDDNGMALMEFKNVLGTFEIEVVFDGDGPYLSTSAGIIFTIKPTIILPDENRYAYNSKYVVYLLDSEGNPLSDRNVTVGPYGEVLTTDSNGMLSLNIDFAPGNYTMSIVNPQTTELAYQDIQVVSKITENSNLIMYYGAGKSYTLRVCDDYGNFVKGIGVKIKLNGKTYTKYSDENGYVSLKISLKPGKYTVTADSNGYKVSNKITVKTTIVTKDITVKKGNNIKFNAKILNSNGKVLKNKVVTFKFKGKLYKIKTNSKGIAKLNIKNPYKVGTYKIYTKYGTLTVKNSIKIVK